MRIKKLTERGIGLVETIASIGIAIIVLTSLVSLSVFTLRSSIQSKLLIQSTKLVNQELELVRAYRDSKTWTEFTNDMTAANCFNSNCYMELSPTLAVSAGIETIGSGSTQSNRSFKLSNPTGDANLVRIAATVSWKIGNKDQFANNYTEISNWRGN